LIAFHAQRVPNPSIMLIIPLDDEITTLKKVIHEIKHGDAIAKRKAIADAIEKDLSKTWPRISRKIFNVTRAP
jgi:aspartate/glutamate racemase